MAFPTGEQVKHLRVTLGSPDELLTTVELDALLRMEQGAAVNVESQAFDRLRALDAFEDARVDGTSINGGGRGRLTSEGREVLQRYREHFDGQARASE